MHAHTKNRDLSRLTAIKRPPDRDRSHARVVTNPTIPQKSHELYIGATLRQMRKGPNRSLDRSGPRCRLDTVNELDAKASITPVTPTCMHPQGLVRKKEQVSAHTYSEMSLPNNNSCYPAMSGFDRTQSQNRWKQSSSLGYNKTET